MSDETIKTASDGTVKIAVERYNELLAMAAEKAPVITKTIHKTPEMLSQEHKAWGWTFMGAGAALIGISAFHFKLGRVES